MKKLLLVLAALISAAAFAQTTVTIPAQSVTVTIPAQTITIPAQGGTGPVVVPSGGNGGTTAPPVAGTFWLFKDSVFTGNADCAGYSFGSGKVLCGGATVVVTGDEGWQPRFPNDDLNLAGYTFVTVSIKPTQKETFQSGMLAVGDKDLPGSHGAVDIMPYGPNPMVIGQWNTYLIPLKLYGTMPTHAYKIMFLAQGVSSPSTNKTEYNLVGLVP